MNQPLILFLLGGDFVFVVIYTKCKVLEQTESLQMCEIWRHHRGLCFEKLPEMYYVL